MYLLAKFGFDAAENEPLGIANVTGIWEFGRVKIPIPKFPWELGMRTAGPVGVERWVVSCEEARSAFGELYKALWHSAACLPEVLHESGVVAAVLARVCSFEPHLLLLSKIFS